MCEMMGVTVYVWYTDIPQLIPVVYGLSTLGRTPKLPQPTISSLLSWKLVGWLDDSPGQPCEPELSHGPPSNLQIHQFPSQNSPCHVLKVPTTSSSDRPHRPGLGSPNSHIQAAGPTCDWSTLRVHFPWNWSPTNSFRICMIWWPVGWE